MDWWIWNTFKKWMGKILVGEEFDGQNIKMSSLAAIRETNDHCKILTPKNNNDDLAKIKDNAETPKLIKRKRATTSSERTDIENVPNESSVKKRKQADVEEDLKAKQEEKLKFINRFVEISVKYSQFLEKKIERKSTSEDILSHKKEAPKKANIDITKRLKYFEGGKLHPYQIDGVTWLTVLFENSVNGILADEMGLGKTIQVIALLCHLYERKVKGPHLIVAPLSTLGNWEAEFKRFAPQIPVIRLQGLFLEREEQKKAIQHNRFRLESLDIQPVILCSYQIPLSESRFLQKFSWTYVIVDEGHRIKNPDSRLSTELRNLKSENRLLLTGTPLQNDIKELWALYNFLMPELFKDIEGFSSLIELDDMKDKEKIIANEAQTKIISTIHKVLSPFVLRREKKDVLGDMVPKKEIIIYCQLTELQKYLYRTILQRDMRKLMMKKPAETAEEIINSPRSTRRKNVVNYRKFFENKAFMESIFENSDTSSEFDSEESEDGSLKESLLKKSRSSRTTSKEYVPVKCPDTQYMCRLTMQNMTMMLKKAANHPYLIWCPLDPKAKNNQLYVSEELIKHSGKLLVLDNLLPKLKARGHKALIFSTLVMFMDIIEEHLLLRNYNYRRLDGGTDYDDRNAVIDEFNNDPDVFLFLISTRAGGLGLNLTGADTVIFMDRDWNPMVDLQAQDRCHRIGQTKPVMVYSLVAKNTVDEIIIMRGDMKKRLEKLVIQEGKFRTLRRNPDENGVKALEDLLKNEEQLTTVNSNGLLYTNKEINKILDRSDLIKEMQAKNKNKKKD